MLRLVGGLTSAMQRSGKAVVESLDRSLTAGIGGFEGGGVDDDVVLR